MAKNRRDVLFHPANRPNQPAICSWVFQRAKYPATLNAGGFQVLKLYELGKHLANPKNTDSLFIHNDHQTPHRKTAHAENSYLFRRVTALNSETAKYTGQPQTRLQ